MGSPPEWMITLALGNRLRFPTWSWWECVRMTVSTSFGKTPICLNDVLMAGFMYSVLGSTTIRRFPARMRTDVESATRMLPSASRSRRPTQRMSSDIIADAMPCGDLAFPRAQDTTSFRYPPAAASLMPIASLPPVLRPG